MTDPTREAAYALLAAVLDRHRSLETALDALPAMEARDRSAGHRLAATVLRRLGTLDAVLEPFLTKAPPASVKHVLRIGAAGLLLLETRPHAAVATAVALVRQVGAAPFAGLVNAVLRRVATAGATALDGLDGPRLDTPPWLWRSWGAAARAIACAHAQEAPLDLTLAPGAAPLPGGEMLPTGTQRFPVGTHVTALPGYAQGRFWVQDAAAALPARLLAVRPGERVADLCAAPGGKTAQLAAAGAAVTAVDRDPARLDRLRANLLRLGLDATVVAADVITWQPDAAFDAILLDAPCSATGTIRRHPDVMRLRRPADIAALVARQQQMLAACGRLLRPGGRLIFAVCSLQPEEAAVQPPDGLAVAPFAPDALPGGLIADGCLRTRPGAMDGFFAVRMVKVE